MVSDKPTLYLTNKDLPEIKTWKVGESYDLIVSVKQVSLHDSGNGNMSASFEIQNVMSAEKDPMDLEDVNNMADNEDFMMGSAKMKQDAYSK